MSGITMADDGRELDPRLADVEGIAAGQQPLLRPDRSMPGAGQQVWQGSSPASTYYEQPVIKAPPWGPKVAAYLVAGGVAGSSAALSAACATSHPRLSRVSMALAFTAGGSGAGLLVGDLGRPERFLHMVRVVRPTSVMNVGGYLLSATTAAALAATVFGQRPLGRVAGTVAAVTGLPLAAYTGVLLGATAVPGWNVAVTVLPPLFLSSGMATSGSMLRLMPVGDDAQRVLDVYTAAGQVGELAAGAVVERRLRDRPRIQAAYEGVPGWRVGKWLTIASLAVGVLPTRRRRAQRLVAGMLGLAGSALTKTAVFDAGMRSAADPLAVPEGGA